MSTVVRLNAAIVQSILLTIATSAIQTTLLQQKSFRIEQTNKNESIITFNSGCGTPPLTFNDRGLFWKYSEI